MFGLDIFEIAIEFRAIAAVILLLLVGSWTWDRIVGNGQDPTLSASTFGLSGGLSVLITGVHAVALVVGVAVYLMWPTFAESPQLLFIPVGIVAMHYYFEDMERGSSGFFRGESDDD